MSPILSVCIRSYNQDQYIAQAIDSVLMQRTSFDFEIIVCDDASSDNTVSIVKGFQAKDSRIRFYQNEHNQGGPKTLRKVIEKSQSKYLAFLDGDDYYTDVFKLEKQVSFLESHPEYVACFHNVVNRFEDDVTRPSLFLPLDFSSHHDCVSVISKDWFLPIHSVVLRRELVFFPEWYDQVMNDDYVVNLSVVMHGPYYYMPDVMAVYRHHKANVSINYSSQILIDTQLRTILAGFRDIYPAEYRPVFDQRIAFYDERIVFNIRETKQPWRKYLRLKTYKRMLKRLIGIK